MVDCCAISLSLKIIMNKIVGIIFLNIALRFRLKILICPGFIDKNRLSLLKNFPTSFSVASGKFRKKPDVETSGCIRTTNEKKVTTPAYKEEYGLHLQ